LRKSLRSLEGIREKLQRAQARFCRVADASRADDWGRKPEPGSWSPGEIVAHLTVVERGIIRNADLITQQAEMRIPFRQRLHLPLWLVEARIIRRKSPVPLDPVLMAEKETMLACLRGARERTLAFLSETEKTDLQAYYWRHPFLGMLNAYEWMEMIAAHQVRHAKQMKEVEERFSRKL